MRTPGSGRKPSADARMYNGRWRSPAAIERLRAKKNARSKAKRAATSKRLSAEALKRKYERGAERMRRGTITFAQIRAEGVRDIVRAAGTSVLFVFTERGVRIFHAAAIPERPLDAYATELATSWLESGRSLEWIARALDLSPTWLSSELARNGYVLKSKIDGKPRAGATKRLFEDRDKNGRRGSPIKHGQAGSYGFAARSS